MNRYFILAAVFLLCTGMACNTNSKQNVELKDDLDQLDKSVTDEKFQQSDSTFQTGQEPIPQIIKERGAQPVKIDWGKKIVRTAKLSAEVKDYKTFNSQLPATINQYGGYISNEDQKQNEYQIENTLVIKVPVDQFENLVNALVKDLPKVNMKQVTSEDVTTALVDGKSRLEAKKQVRLRYLDLLKGARNMGEILEVQKEINEIQEDIEMVSGRISMLSHASAMSTIHFSYFQVLDPAAKINEQKEEAFFHKLRSAVSNGWYWIGEFFITLASIWPLLVGGIIFYILYRKKSSRLNKTQL